MDFAPDFLNAFETEISREAVMAKANNPETAETHA
jgi:hypothetical protein